MAVVIVERTFRAPVSGAQLLDFDRRKRWCFQAHGIGPKGHLLSQDGLRVCCVIDAPDAECVRIAGRKAEMPPPDRVWSATVHGPVPDVAGLPRRGGRSDRSLAVVERSFPESVRFDEMQSVEDRGAWCLGLNRVEFLVSWLSLDRRRMICLYDAPDAEAVSRTNARLGLPLDRVWSAALHVCDESAGQARSGG